MPFHQDNFYWNIINGEAVNVWIACSKVNNKNGGVIYLKGQELGVINHELSYKPVVHNKYQKNFIKIKKFLSSCPKLNPGIVLFIAVK